MNAWSHSNPSLSIIIASLGLFAFIFTTKYLNNTPTMSNALSIQDVHKTNKKSQTHALNIQVSVNQLHQYKHKENKHHFILQRYTKCNHYVDNPALDDNYKVDVKKKSELQSITRNGQPKIKFEHMLYLVYTRANTTTQNQKSEARLTPHHPFAAKE
ncbi:hypothetical protein YC2023_066868 [Brassica napus]